MTQNVPSPHVVGGYERLFLPADQESYRIIGLPFTPLSFAGVARRTARRAA
jgi:hypothetical protein